MAAFLILLFQAKGTYFPTALFVPPVAEAKSEVEYLIVWRRQNKRRWWNRKASEVKKKTRITHVGRYSLSSKWFFLNIKKCGKGACQSKTDM